MPRPHLVEVDAKFGFGFGAADFDGDFEACAIFFEEWVEGFGDPALPSGEHLGGGGVGADEALELEGLAVEAVVAGEVYARSGHLVVEGGDMDDGVVEREASAHLRGDGLGVGGVGLFGMALGALAELVDGLLPLGVAERGAGDGEGALDAHFFRDADGAGRDVEAGVEGEGSAHEGRAGFGAEAEDVFDAGVVAGDGELDLVAGLAG